MAAQIAAYGRLVADPRPIETRSGKAMIAARIAVTVECRDGGGETSEETLWLSVLAFWRVVRGGGSGPAREGRAGERVKISTYPSCEERVSG